MRNIEHKEAFTTYISNLFGMLQDYPNFMTTQDVQDALNMGEKQLKSKIHSGEIVAINYGTSYRIPKMELVLYLANNLLNLSALKS